MTWNNPNPLANPFNQRNYRCSFNKNNKTLPQSSFTYEQIMQQQAQLHVPQSYQPSIRLKDLQNIVDDYQKNMTWDDRSIYNIHSNSLDNNQELSKRDIEYWNHANKEAIKLSANLSKEWSQYIDEFEAKHPSKWVDDLEN